MSMIRLAITGVLVLFFTHISFTQNDDMLDLKEVFDNNEELEALALYPDDIRDGILELCLYPELIVKLGAIQNRTQDLFQEIIQYQSEEVQKNYWELLRYPGLVEGLVVGGQKSRKQINDILKSYPEEVHAIALDYGTSRYRTLEKINAINNEANKALTLLLADYSNSTQDKVQLLLKFPEVLHIMVDNIDVAILVGEYYEDDPKAVLARANELKLEVARRNQKDIEDWKKGLENDPRALEEFEEVSEEFKEEVNGYTNYDPMYPNASLPEEEEKSTSTNANQDVYVEYNYYPYPYWFGYPSWFPHVYWYRYPYWYHWGFYYGPQRSLIILGLPSYYYFHWYFGYPTHYYRYPYLSDYIIRYYRSRRGVGPFRNSLTTSVDYWNRNRRSRIPESILEEKDDYIRRQKLMEFGRFEEEYRRRVSKRPEETGNREEYLNKYSNRYQYLSGKTREQNKRSETTPTPRQQSSIRTRKPPSSVQLNRARETHQRTWQQKGSRSKNQTPASRSKSSTTTRKKKRNN